MTPKKIIINTTALTEEAKPRVMKSRCTRLLMKDGILIFTLPFARSIHHHVTTPTILVHTDCSTLLSFLVSLERKVKKSICIPWNIRNTLINVNRFCFNKFLTCMMFFLCIYGSKWLSCSLCLSYTQIKMVLLINTVTNCMINK